MCLCYSFCWCCIFLWLGFRILKPEYVRPWHSHLSLIIVTSNSMMNPLIYGMASPEYRRTLHNMFRKGWRKAMSMALASADLTSQNYNSENEDHNEQPSTQPSGSNATVNASAMKEKKELSKIEISTIESVRAWAFPIWGWILSLFTLGSIKLYCFWRAMSEDWFKNAIVVGPRFFGIAIYNGTSRFMPKWITKASSASKFFNYFKNVDKVKGSFVPCIFTT